MGELPGLMRLLGITESVQPLSLGQTKIIIITNFCNKVSQTAKTAINAKSTRFPPSSKCIFQRTDCCSDARERIEEIFPMFL